MNKRRFVVATFGVVAVLGGIGYGCDDDKPAPAGNPTTLDSGPGRDTAVGDQSSPPQDTGLADVAKKFTAKADITATGLDASTVSGVATFTEENGQVTVVVTLSNAFPPGGPGLRGMHIHQNASCGPNDSGVDGATVFAGAAGPHWNPLDASHGLPTAAAHHIGDMGNIMIGDAGTGTLTLISKDWTVQPGGMSVVGHAVVFHAQEDDGVSQPVGNAGARPGCGVIVLQ